MTGEWNGSSVAAKGASWASSIQSSSLCYSYYPSRVALCYRNALCTIHTCFNLVYCMHVRLFWFITWVMLVHQLYKKIMVYRNRGTASSTNIEMGVLPPVGPAEKAE